MLVLVFFLLRLCPGSGFGLGLGAESDVESEPRGRLGQLSLNEMFREVGRLMEDTQQKLDEAVHQMANESSKSLYGYNLPSSFYNHNKTEAKQAGDTEESLFSQTHIQDSRWNEVDHECLIDEDCDEDSYCLYQINTSKCTPCKPTNTECEKDEECCGDQLCVWGLCARNKTRGQSGTICHYQSDCSPQHCCAFHRAFLFPVCRPRPQEGQPCFDQPNQLLELLLWDEDAPREHCPCAADMQCQPAGQKTVCLKQTSSSRHDSMKDSP